MKWKRKTLIFYAIILLLPLFFILVPETKAASLLFSADFDDTNFNTTSSQDVSSTFGQDSWHIQIVIDGSHSRFWTDDGTTGESVPSLRRAGSKVACLQIKGGSSGDRNEFNMKPYDMGFGQKAYVRTWLYLESNFTLGSDPDYNEITDPISTNDGGASYPMVKGHIRTNGTNYNFITFYAPDSDPAHRVFDYSNDLWNVAVTELPRGRWFQLSWLVDRSAQTCTSWLTDEGVTICIGDFSGSSLGYPAYPSWKSIIAKLYSNFKNKYYRLWCDGWEVWDDTPTETFAEYPPLVTLLSPIGTYFSSPVSLTFTINDTAVWIGYSLDGAGNTTIGGNTTLTASFGIHSIRVYANNSGGEMGASSLGYFTLSFPLSFTSYTAPSSSMIASGSATFILASGSSIAIQEETRYLTMTLTSGSINETASLTMYQGSGEFHFTGSATATMRLDYNFSNVKYKVNDDPLTVISDGATFSFLDNEPVVISWSEGLEPLFPILFALGMFGLASLFGSGVYGAYLINNRDFNQDKLILCLVTFAMGFGLFIAWVMA